MKQFIVVLAFELGVPLSAAAQAPKREDRARWAKLIQDTGLKLEQ